MHSPQRIRRQLLYWYTRNQRDLPWRRTKDPYRIWVSEIMLQQTRVAAVIPYYERFVARFPTVEALAASQDAEVLACWSGLGYYSRVRNLVRAARQIQETGEFPRDYAGIRRLPGVGDYTAAAIASMAFSLPFVALDGNVMRVMARLTADEGNIEHGPVRRRLHEAANRLLCPENPGDFNQALMELGATVCLPKAPLCGSCPLAKDCAGYRAGMQDSLPVKSRKKPAVVVELTLLVIGFRGRILFRRRGDDAQRMAGFWELPEADHLPGVPAGEILGQFQHTITNHRYRITLRRAGLRRAPEGMVWLGPEEWRRRPLTTAARKALRILAASHTGPRD